MSSTYTQMYVHIVFAVHGRANLLPLSKRDQLEKYIAGIIKIKRHKLLSIYCMPDHTHLLIGLHPSHAVSDLVRDIKTGSTLFIKKQGWVRGAFSWQHGFGCFTYSKSQIAAVSRYIERQPEHRQRRSFKSEFIDILQKFEVGFEEKYLFQWIDLTNDPECLITRPMRYIG